MKKICLAITILLSTMAVKAQVIKTIDPLNGDSLSAYTDTLVNDTSDGAGDGVSFSDSSGGLVASYVGTSPTDPEQALFLAPTNSFGTLFTTGEVLAVTTVAPAGTTTEDFGLAISATATPPAAASGNSWTSRALFDWASISIRPSQTSIRINTSTNGVLTTAANVIAISNPTNISQLFIQWNTTNAFTLGYVSNGVSFVAARVAFEPNSTIGKAIGFYGDLRATATSLGTYTNLTISPIIIPSINITQQPASENVAPNNQPNLSVTANGPGTLGYQWYFYGATTNLILNATNATYFPPPTSTLGATNFYVVITNGISTPATSSVATVTVRTPSNLEWAGTGASWDTSSPNWTANGNVSQTAFTDADNATFDNLGQAQPIVSVAQSLHPTSITVNGATSYTLSGPGSIGGPGALTMNGSGTLLMDNTNNTYLGGTFINSGTLQVGDGTISSSLGAGPVTNNAALVAMAGTALAETFPARISGSGTLTASGAGDVTLSTSNNFTGGVTVNNGRILMGDPNALGTGSVVVNSGAQVYLLGNSGTISPSALTLNGVGTAGSPGALRKGNQTTSTFGGPVTLGSATTLDVDGSAVLNLTGASGINGVSANANLTLAGAGAGNIGGPLALGSGSLTVNGGTWTVAPTNNYTGLTTIQTGTLLLTGPLSLGPVPASFNASDVTMNGGTLGAATNVILNDGNIGIQLTANATISAVTNATFTISNQISDTIGAVTLTKAGPGTVILQGVNPFNGTLNVDTANNTANDGTLVIANNGAIAQIPAVTGQPFIFIGDNNTGHSTLALDGTLGNITVAPDIQMTGRNVAIPTIESLTGNNTISGNISLSVGGGDYIFQSDAGTLALTATLPFTTPTNSGRVFTFQGNGKIVVSAPIVDGINNGSSNVWDGIIQQGPGLLTLSAPNTYSGTTTVNGGVLSVTSSLNSVAGVTVSGGLLVDNSSITGPVTVNGTGSIEAGTTNTIGTLTLGNTLALSGNTVAKIKKSNSTEDLFTGQTSVTYGGTLTVTNLGGTLALGDSFTLFSPGASASNFSSIIGSPGTGLAYSFTNGVLSVVVGIPTTPTNITFAVSGNVLTLSWPSSYQGWTLQAQTNPMSVGISTNWVNVPNSASVTSTNITMNPNNPTVFYRLMFTH